MQQQLHQQGQRKSSNNKATTTTTTKMIRKQPRQNRKHVVHSRYQIEQDNGVLITTMLRKSHKNENSNDSDENRNINYQYQNRFLKSSHYYSPCYI